MYVKSLLLLFLLGLTTALAAQPVDEAKYSLPRRMLPLEKFLIKLNQAGAELSYRSDQVPQLALRVPAGRRSIASWLRILLRNTELAFESTSAGYIIYPDPNLPEQRFTIFGTISDASSGERLIAAAVRDSLGSGLLSNEYGFYSLTLPGGRRQVEYSYVGYSPRALDFVLRADTILDVKLRPARNLPEVIVTPTPEGVNAEHLTETRSSVGPQQTRQMGGFGGVADPLRLARLLPGVESGADGLGGIFIRGSEAGHNLVLLDGVPVYNLNHAAGLLSIFSNQVIRRVDIYKDGLPSRFGGRIGGVIDVHTREGNLYAPEVSAGADLLTTFVSAEGPLQRGRSSFLVTGRIFWGSGLLRHYSEQSKSRKGRSGRMDYQVYDLNVKYNTQVGKSGHLYFSLFNGKDDYANGSRIVDDETTLSNGGGVFPYRSIISRQENVKWGNTVGALRYNHLFSDRLFGNFRLSYSDLVVDAAYEKADSLLERFGNFEHSGDIYSGLYGSDIRQLGAAFDGQLQLPAARKLRFGGEFNYHRFLPQLIAGPAAVSSYPALSELSNDAALRPWQFSVYSSYSGTLPKLRYRLGLRTNLWHSGRSFIHFSPQFLLAGQINERMSWRFTYDQAVQPIHLISSTIIGLPSDLWVPATEDFGPSTSYQGALQFTRRLGSDWNLVAAAYYRRSLDLVRFTEDGENWQRNLSRGTGTARGVELTFNRTRGLFSGWGSLALTSSTRHFDERINLGKPFDFRYGRPYSFKALVRYQPRPGLSITANFRYGAGAAYSLSEVTLRLADPAIAGAEGGEVLTLDITKEVNGVRLPPNHRLDINAHLQFGDRRGKRLRHALSVGLYNVYNRHNPIYYDIESNYKSAGENLVNARRFKQVYLPGMLPVLSYHMTFRARGSNTDFGD